MAETDLQSATYGDMTNRVNDFSVPAMVTDAAGNQDETEYMITNWSSWFGYYKQIPELKKAIDMKAVWTIGKGYKAEPYTQVILDHIKGWGTDTFNAILKNMVIVMQICGDAFAEIIRDKKSGKLINLKPLDPSSMKIIVNRKGIIKRYEQVNKTSEDGVVVMKFEPEQIFHLSRDRVADEIHGTGVVESVEKIILMRNETMEDVKKVMHRYVKPMMKFTLDTDDPVKIDALAAKFDAAVNKGENLYIPKGSVEHELISVPSNATLNPMPWIENLSGFFFQAVGIPRIILGGSQEFTEATAKIAYLAFQQSVEDEQLNIESQVWEQLRLRIELEFPASLENELLSDEKKDRGTLNAFEPEDMRVGVGQE